MATRFYIVPKTGDGLTPFTAFRPKYFDGIKNASMDYGREDAMLVGADVTGVQHTTIAANADVIAVPLNIDDTVGAALNTVQTKLEAIKMPSGWVNANHTFRQVLGVTGRIFKLMQSFDGLNHATFFEAGLTLDTRVNQLTTGQRNKIQAAAVSLGLPIDFITGTMTLRVVFKTWADSMGSFPLAGETF